MFCHLLGILQLALLLVRLGSLLALGTISHLDITVPVVHEVLSPSLVLFLQHVRALVLDEEEREGDTESSAAGGDDKGVSLSKVV
mgnify:CR=1 FL=1